MKYIFPLPHDLPYLSQRMPMLIRHPSMANKKVNELTIFIADSASLPILLPTIRLLIKLVIVVPKIVSIVGKRYFLSILLIKLSLVCILKIFTVMRLNKPPAQE